MAKNISYHHKEQIKLREEYYEIDGKKEGVYKSYYDNGQLKEICNYIDGKRNGKYKLYHYNGYLDVICNYIDGKIQR